MLLVNSVYVCFFRYFNVLFFIQPVFYSVVIMLKFPGI